MHKEAYNRLLGWIVEGRLAPGEKLRDIALADNLGVSRTPVREALLRLEEEGFVETKPNRSTQVTPISLDDAYPLYSIVWTLEALALSEALPHIQESDIREMTQINEQFLKEMKKGRRAQALKADYDFHAIFIRRANNPELTEIISKLKSKLRRLDLYYYERVQNATLSYQEHKQLIMSLEENNRMAALRAVEDNWKSSFRRFNIEGGEDV